MDKSHFHLHFLQCDNVRALSIKVVAPKSSPNTDEIHIEASTNVLISELRCYIDFPHPSFNLEYSRKEDRLTQVANCIKIFKNYVW